MEKIVKYGGGNYVQSMEEIERAARLMAGSGFFEDTRELAQAAVKIMAGAELGIGPYAAMTGINIIRGKPVLGASLLASLVRRGGVYDYAVDDLSDTRCVITFYRQGRKLGTSEFTQADAQRSGAGRADTTRSGQTNLQKFPKNILFARAMSNGVRWYCPDILIGGAYVPEEMDDGQELVEPEIGMGEAERIEVISERQPDFRAELLALARSARPYAPEEFRGNFILAVEHYGKKQARVDAIKRAAVRGRLTSIISDEHLKVILENLTGFSSFSSLTDAQVLAFERVLEDLNLAEAELKWLVEVVRDPIIEDQVVDDSEDPFPLANDMDDEVAE